MNILEIDNISCTKISVSFSMDNKSSTYTDVVLNYTLPHNKVKSLTTGCFLTKYIKVVIHKGKPISLKGISIFGQQVTNKEMFNTNIN